MIQPSQPSPNTEPTRVALRTISEARRILEEVVTSSESFDYPKAKEGLKQLQRMIRELGREEARLRASPLQSMPAIPADGAKVLPFPVE